MRFWGIRLSVVLSTVLFGVVAMGVGIVIAFHMQLATPPPIHPGLVLSAAEKAERAATIKGQRKADYEARQAALAANAKADAIAASVHPDQAVTPSGTLAPTLPER